MLFIIEHDIYFNDFSSYNLLGNKTFGGAVSATGIVIIEGAIIVGIFGGPSLEDVLFKTSTRPNPPLRLASPPVEIQFPLRLLSFY